MLPSLNNLRVLRVLRVLLLLSVLAACAAPAPPRPTPPPAASVPLSGGSVSAPTSNLTDGCVRDYDPAVDYFPAKLTLDYATGWQISYHNHYKLLTVTQPWLGADTQFEYVLVQCGTPVPDGYPTAQVIEVPARSIITMSTTHLPHILTLGLLDRLVGVDTAAFINAPEVRERVASGAAAEIGSGATVNVERVLELEPSLVMTFGSGDPQFDSHPALLAAGVPVAINAEFLEPSPLGQAEWLKFTAAFFNHEAAAQQHFAALAAEYTALREQVAAALATDAERPTVLVGAPYQGTWFVAGGKSHIAQLIADAGGQYVWADVDKMGAEPVSFEAVLARASDADFWINTSTWASRAEALAEDERFSNFTALTQQRVYNNNARVNEQGGNDYFESGLANPQLLLADLVAIFHPELLPDHTLVYYQQLP